MRFLKPWQRARMVREFLAERDQRVAAAEAAKRPTRFAIGQRVRIVGGSREDTITAILPHGKPHRYRLADSTFVYFESDLEAMA
jgi:hypothetical protein